jgi:sialate O-acetylesterase
MKKQMILLGMLMAFCMAEAKVTLPALFTDNMVLQQKSNVIFHGHSSTFFPTFLCSMQIFLGN